MSKLIILSFFFLLPICSFSQSNKKVDLFELIKMSASTSDYKSKDWNTISKSKIPIIWETEGNEFTGNNELDKTLGFFVRKGKISMPLNMNELVKSTDIVEWNIRVYGSRIAISNLFLSNDFLAHENCFDSECVQSYFKKKGAAIKLIQCDEENMLTGGKRFYEIVIKKRPKIFLTVEFSCGSAGCSGNYIFHSTYPNEEYFLMQELTNSNCN